MMERNNNSREILKEIIENFSTEKFIHFFRNKNTSFRPMQEDLLNYNDGDFTSGEKIGEIKFQDSNLIICSFQVLKELSERSGKKKQYELGKRILKKTNTDAGIFIFYDGDGNFRFSLIYTEYFDTKRKFSYFKRFTYFVSPRLTNKTFLEQIGEADFSSIEKIKEAFSVEPVTKQFYQEIANWYFWTIKNVHFPDDAEKEPNGRNIAVIRLITRIIFIWFMKERHLIPNDLFNEKKLPNILNNFNLFNDNYYKAILQNLFFATLNTRQEERRFRSDKRGYKGYNTDFGNHNVYRYENLFKDSEEVIEKYFLPIPFLNGGLFECLDYKSKNKEERKYIDGFTDLKKYQPQVPNYLFFAEEEIVDLSEDYNDTKYKRTKVKGLINTLSQYNFTIDENEPDDVEIALDPELLGEIFENLLASYNPETATTARKATGSYYTPREIVDYMVDESLKEYFKTHIPEIEEEKLNKLFVKEDTTNPFDNTETGVKLINLIDSLRIVDPAVGSGAFPMRVLSRLVFLLHKLDPDNSQWKKIQIDGILKSVKDPILQKELINQVEKRFKENNPDYGRKLYLIEKCIYGVDIQQIAVEIAKLRFFISLLVDETIDFDKKDQNYGIEPLPNLDFKIMQGNSLISSFYGIYFKQEPGSKDMLFDLDERHKQLISEFEELKSQYQNEPDVIKKRDLRKKIDEKVVEIFEEKLNEHLPEIKQIEENAKQLPKKEDKDRYIKEEKGKLFKKLGFDLEKAKEDLIAYTKGRKEKDFFLWGIYFAEVFAEKGGFDIVIGNPPYVRADRGEKHLELRKKIMDSKQYQTLWEKWDLYVAFIERGFNLLCNKGILEFIIPDAYMSSKYAEKSHDYFLNNAVINRINFCSDIKIFEQAVRNIIIEFKREINPNHIPVRIKHIGKWDNSISLPSKKQSEMGRNTFKLDSENKTFGDLSNTLTWCEICYVSKGMVLNADEIRYQGDFKKEDLISDYQDKIHLKKYIEAKWTKRYYIEVIKYLEWNTDRVPQKISRPTFPELYVPEKIIKGRMTDAVYDDTGLLCNDSCFVSVLWKDLKGVQNRSIEVSIKKDFKVKTVYPLRNQLEENSKQFNLKYLLAILNSKFAYKFLNFVRRSQIGFYPDDLKKLPIKKISLQEQQPFITLVDQILSAKKQNPQADTSELECQIDQMVYKLYGLTEEEIKIIENFRKERDI